MAARNLICSAVLICVSIAAAMSQENKPIAGIHGLAIDDKDISKLEVMALDGDGESAHRLALHYQMVQPNRKLAIQWATVSAENGSLHGQYMVGFLLRDDPDSKNRRRARFWLCLLYTSPSPRD